MSSASLEPTPVRAFPATCEECGSFKDIELPDATKLNGLLDYVQSRLSSDVHGNLIIKGTRLSNDRRHGDLGELFTLMNKLESSKASMDTYITLHTPKEVVKVEKPAKLTENMTGVIRNVVDDHVGDRLRTLSIRCERLEEQLKTANTKLGAVESKREDGRKVKALDTKLTKALNELETKVVHVIGDRAGFAPSLGDTIFGVVEQVNELQASHGRVKRDLGRAEADVDGLKTCVGFGKFRGSIIDDLTKDAKALWCRMKLVEEDATELNGASNRFRKLVKGWKTEHDDDIRSLRRELGTIQARRRRE